MTLSVQFGRSTFPSYNTNHTKSPKQPQPKFGMDEFSLGRHAKNNLNEIAQTARRAQENRDNAVKMAIQKMIEEGFTFPMNRPDKDGNTLLHQAASALDYKNMQILLRTGAKPTRNKDGFTPLELAKKAEKSRLSTIALHSVKVEPYAENLYEEYKLRHNLPLPG
jgi:hypothetical protein